MARWWVCLLLLLPHALGLQVKQMHEQGLPENARYLARSASASVEPRRAGDASPLKMPSAQLCRRGMCVPNAVQRRAVQQVRELGFVQRLAFAHSTKAAGSTVDLVLWNMAHTLNTSMFVRPEHNWAEVQVRPPRTDCLALARGVGQPVANRRWGGKRCSEIAGRPRTVHRRTLLVQYGEAALRVEPDNGARRLPVPHAAAPPRPL